MCIICCILCLALQAPNLVLGVAAMATRLAVPAAIAAASLVGATGTAVVHSAPAPATRIAVVSSVTGSTSRATAKVTRLAPAAVRPAVTKALHPAKTAKKTGGFVIRQLPHIH